MNLKIFISTSDRTQFILEIFSKIWNKRAGFDCTVLGYNQNVSLPDNFEFVRIAESQTDAKEWAGNLRRYLSTIWDEYVIFLLDDYLIKSWNQKNFNLGFERMLVDKNIARYELGHFSHFSTGTTTPGHYQDIEGFKYLDHNRPYRVSCQPSVWRRDWLMLCLQDGFNPHLFEVKGSKARANDGRDVICSNNKPALEYGHQTCWSGQDPKKVPWAGKLNIAGTHPEDRPELEKFAKKYNLEIHE